ncbi:hypothetical protein BHE74_00027100 [Ensete ventricosum]|uniref:Uncharacterized protein n=1 Tax=Ensete ventricosum TaxID=4639 RepID=A0A444GBR5_ENSVE|nr:hypothetical protein GW17_00003021 [Ensete ventricosum]RWW65583.1 hypothetical protein BHE74_00027100 [Ensete ventricosum]RZR72738.1 hypothetical protein BHM03_00016213 [Ensete ventricosum]
MLSPTKRVEAVSSPPAIPAHVPLTCLHYYYTVIAAVRSDLAHGTRTLRRRHVYRRDVRKKVTHDLLSLYSPDSSFQLQDPRASSQGLFLKTRDFLQPLDREDKGGEAADGGSVPAERNACSISHVGGGQGAEKPEGSALWALPTGLQTKPEPDYGSRSISTSYGSHAGGVSYTLWDDNDTASRAAPAQILSEKLENMPSTMHGSPATDVPAGNSNKTTEAATRFASNMAVHDQSPWPVRSCREMLNEQEELAIDDGTISVSTAYSHG